MNRETLEKIRKTILEKKGENINLKAMYGRRGKLVCQGVVDGVYPEIFTVLVEKDDYVRKYCYTYSEVLTNNVEITSII